MTPACAGCGSALSDPRQRACGVCGLRVGDLPSNVDELRAQENARRSWRRGSVRPILRVLVLGLMLTLAIGAGSAASQPEAQPVLVTIGHTAQMVAQAAESQIARRSRLPGPGDPESEQWKRSAVPQLLVVAVLAGGLILFVRTRMR
jgi:hypothetical protein